MKTNRKPKVKESEAQTGKDIKKGLPVKNAMTNSVRNTGTQTSGLNQAKTSRDDLFPSDGDNLTN